MTILEKVNFPQDLKPLSREELQQLADEIRAYLVETVSKTGGHLAPNLGVVELTIALHYVFNMPKDRLVFDVGHQCYTHKILTGRKDDFVTLRQFQGLSGFPKPRESEYDSFMTGHSSTSVSVALGMAEALRLQNAGNHVVAVLGDGALTGGMVYEAMNHGGGLETPFIVVLNDNEMSIAKNVGSLAGHLARLRTSPRYSRSKRRVKDFLRHLPLIGKPIANFTQRWKNSLKYFLLPGVLFEEMGFTYLGPVDGHNIADMISVLQLAKTVQKPTLVHVLTKKGKGYKPAEMRPNAFHGTGPFDVRTGIQVKNGSSSYTECFSAALLKETSENKKIVAITAAMADGTGLVPFARAYPRRFFDVGIAEEHAVTFAGGMAATGLRPIVALYATFLQRCYDQLLHDICLPNLPVILAVDRAGLVGEDGETHQGVFDTAILRTMPNMTVAMPADAGGLQAMLSAALQQKTPVAIRYPKGAAPLDISPAPLVWGKGAWLRQEGDALLLAVGPMVDVAMQAAALLDERAVSVAVADLRFIKPLDEEMLLLAAGYRHIFILEEAVATGGAASGCLEFWQSRGLNPQTEKITLPDAFIPQGTVEELRQKYGLTAEAIAEKVISHIG